MKKRGGKERSDGDGRRLTCAAELEEEDGRVQKERMKSTSWSEGRRGWRWGFISRQKGGNPSLPARIARAPTHTPSPAA